MIEIKNMIIAIDGIRIIALITPRTYVNKKAIMLVMVTKRIVLSLIWLENIFKLLSVWRIISAIV